MKVGTFIHCRFIRWKETKSAVREGRGPAREREVKRRASARARESFVRGCRGRARDSERIVDRGRGGKGFEICDQGRECRGGERVNSAKEKGSVIIKE
jgi:hypothetical protein